MKTALELIQEESNREEKTTDHGQRTTDSGKENGDEGKQAGDGTAKAGHEAEAGKAESGNQESGVRSQESEGTGDAGGQAEVADGKVEFSPEQQAVFEKRLGKETAKTKAIREELETLKTKLDELSKTADGHKAALEGQVRVHPEWCGTEDLTVIRKAGALEAEIESLRDNWGGVESDDPKQARTAQQVQQRFAEASGELAAIRDRADTAYKAAQKQMIEDAKLGRQVRMEREEARKKVAGAQAGAGKDGGKKTGLAGLAGVKPGRAPEARGGVDPRKLPAENRTAEDIVKAMG